MFVRLFICGYGLTFFLFFNYVQIILFLLIVLIGISVAHIDIVMTSGEHKRTGFYFAMNCLLMLVSGYVVSWSIYWLFFFFYPVALNRLCSSYCWPSCTVLLLSIIVMLFDLYRQVDWKKYSAFMNKSVAIEYGVELRNTFLIALITGFGTASAYMGKSDTGSAGVFQVFYLGLVAMFSVVLFHYVLFLYSGSMVLHSVSDQQCPCSETVRPPENADRNAENGGKLSDEIDDKQK